jgi:Tol biopolymer transport system component
MRILVATCCLILLIATTSIAKIVFEQTTNAVSSIYVMEDDGTAATLLTDTLNPIVPKWSPDGKSIVFARGRHIQSKNISIMNADGTEIRDITVPVRDPRSEWHPSFSPDGKSIVFSRYDLLPTKTNSTALW